MMMMMMMMMMMPSASVLGTRVTTTPRGMKFMITVTVLMLIGGLGFIGYVAAACSFLFSGHCVVIIPPCQ